MFNETGLKLTYSIVCLLLIIAYTAIKYRRMTEGATAAFLLAGYIFAVFNRNGKNGFLWLSLILFIIAISLMRHAVKKGELLKQNIISYKQLRKRELTKDIPVIVAMIIIVYTIYYLGRII